VSAPRVDAIDRVRGASVLLMIGVHTLVFFGTAAAQTRGLVALLLGVGKATAVFVVCLGVSSVLARDATVGGGLRRGARLFAYGVGLNALKFLVPLLLFGGLPEALVRDVGRVPGDPSNVWYFLFLGDILALAGIATAVLAVLRKLEARPVVAFALAAAVALASPFVGGWRGGGVLLAYVCDLFFSTHYSVFFPVFPWLSFALTGYGLGAQLRATSDASRLLRRWFGAGLALLAAGAAVYALWPAAFAGRDFYRAGPGGVAASTGFALATFHLASRLPLGPRALELLRYASRNVTRLYVVSWVVIVWATKPLGFMQYESALALLGLNAFVLASTFAVDALLRGKVPRLRFVQGEQS
jgi:uncharacterized membrane protein